MAKELPYFKFIVADWLTGDIVYEPFNVQGLFVNICSIYWQRSGILSMEDINKRYKNPVELKALIGRFLHLQNDRIYIKFLDEQFCERKRLSDGNAKNGQKGGIAKATKTKHLVANAKRTPSEPLAKRSNIEKKRKEKRGIPLPLSSEFQIQFSDKLKWEKEKLNYYWLLLKNWSEQGNVYIDWISAAKTWAAKDDNEGKGFKSKQSNL